jgi:hypothetical protein
VLPPVSAFRGILVFELVLIGIFQWGRYKEVVVAKNERKIVECLTKACIRVCCDNDEDCSSVDQLKVYLSGTKSFPLEFDVVKGRPCEEEMFLEEEPWEFLKVQKLNR